MKIFNSENTDHKIPHRSCTPAHELVREDTDVESLLTILNEAHLEVKGFRTMLAECDETLAALCNELVLTQKELETSNQALCTEVIVVLLSKV